MTKANTKPSVAIVYDDQTADHAYQSADMDFVLLEDAKRLGGVINKAWRTGYMVGTMARIAGKDKAWAASVLSKLNANAASDGPKRTATEQRAENAARSRLRTFCKTHSIKPANKQRGKPGAKAKDAPKDNTPKAVSTKQADAYIRMQAAVLKAYAEKNHAVLTLALRSAIAEFAEAVEAVPVALSDEETK